MQHQTTLTLLLTALSVSLPEAHAAPCRGPRCALGAGGGLPAVCRGDAGGRLTTRRPLRRLVRRALARRRC